METVSKSHPPSHHCCGLLWPEKPTRMLAADCICLGGEASPPVAWLAAAFAPKEDFEFSEPMELVRAIERTLLGRCGNFCTTEQKQPTQQAPNTWTSTCLCPNSFAPTHPFSTNYSTQKALLQYTLNSSSGQLTLCYSIASLSHCKQKTWRRPRTTNPPGPRQHLSSISWQKVKMAGPMSTGHSS